MAECPICHHVLPNAEFRPFCSRRCAQVVLGRWLTGAYAVPDESDAGDDTALDLSDDLG